MQVAKPTLANKEQFEKLLKAYRPSSDAIAILNDSEALYLIGPTGSGRNTLIDRLVATGAFKYVLSDTTRPPRAHGDRLERDGEFYWHISEQKFIEGLTRGDYLEAAVVHGQQVSGGNSSEYKKAKNEDKIPITDIEGIYGPPVFHSYSDKEKFIFMVPPGFEEWMKRLNGRGKMAPEELLTRLETSKKEIKAALKRPYYHFLVSRDVDHNVKTVQNIVSGKKSLDSEDDAKQQAEELLEDVKRYMQALTN